MHQYGMSTSHQPAVSLSGVSMTRLADYGAAPEFAHLDCLLLGKVRPILITTNGGKCYGETRDGIDDPSDIVQGQDIENSMAKSFVHIGMRRNETSVLIVYLSALYVLSARFDSS